LTAVGTRGPLLRGNLAFLPGRPYRVAGSIGVEVIRATAPLRRTPRVSQPDEPVSGQQCGRELVGRGAEPVGDVRRLQPA
jgi:hypothetical protein